ncbi:hypothetical protein [Salinigranum salinum]|uniref:hypothetical protein n=1 Tax=Salinigranum salinum TaxID=1364937 RepID=UPI0012608A0C|nr:hypothetical protein [Salinigranum salinum]
MPDTKRGREEQARHEERRQREREIEEAQERADEPRPQDEESTETTETTADDRDGAPTCHRRGCDRPAAFLVLERYLEDTGHGAVEATAELCREHTEEESPTRLDDAYSGYVFRVEPLPGTTDDAEG